MASGAARRYVQAIIELAREANSFEAWQRDLGTLSAIAKDPAIRVYLHNPSVQRADKNKALDAVLADVQPQARNLVHMLVERNRIGIIGELADLFDEAVLAERGIVLVDVTTADPLDEANQELVRSRLKTMLGKDVQLRLHEDPAIIGGFVARAGDQVIDGSVINQLRRLRARLTAA